MSYIKKRRPKKKKIINKTILEPALRKELLYKLLTKRNKPQNKIKYDPSVFPTVESISNYQITDVLQHITIRMNGKKYITNKKYTRDIDRDQINKVLLIEKSKFHMKKYQNELHKDIAKGEQF